ncbi:Solute carrier family 49 member 4-like 4, partial [Homarus americanus]
MVIAFFPEKNPLLGAEDLPQSAISPTVSTSYQNPSLHPVLPDISSDVVDGVIQARGHSQYQYMEDPFLGDKDEDEIKIKIYPSRFWILLVFSVLAWFQCVQWNTWGPLSESVNAAFPGWGSETVAMMANWGTITFVLFVTPMCWLMNTKGLRIGVLCCGILVAGGTVLRVISILTNSTTFFT